MTVEGLDLGRANRILLLLSVRNASTNDLKNELLESIPAILKRPLEQSSDHRSLATPLPEISDADFLCDRLEGDMSSPGRVSRAGEKVVHQIGNVGDRLMLLQRQGYRYGNPPCILDAQRWRSAAGAAPPPTADGAEVLQRAAGPPSAAVRGYLRMTSNKSNG